MRYIVGDRGHLIEGAFSEQVAFTCTYSAGQFVGRSDSLATFKYRFATLYSPIKTVRDLWLVLSGIARGGEFKGGSGLDWSRPLLELVELAGFEPASRKCLPLVLHA